GEKGVSVRQQPFLRKVRSERGDPEAPARTAGARRIPSDFRRRLPGPEDDRQGPAALAHSFKDAFLSTSPFLSFIATSIPEITRAKTVCLRSSSGVARRVMKIWLSASWGEPDFAIDAAPRAWVFFFVFSEPPIGWPAPPVPQYSIRDMSLDCGSPI